MSDVLKVAVIGLGARGHGRLYAYLSAGSRTRSG